MAYRLLTALTLALIMTVPAWANPCALPEGALPFESGMGGTGKPAGTGLDRIGSFARSGLGGTGIQKDDGIGGTGIFGDSGIGGMGATSSGMGGTGISGGGMGGTGAMVDGSGMGGTGVVGIITGFGSICVNGLEIHYDAHTPVAMDGRSVSTKQLAIGEMVAVQASGSTQSLKARRIELSSAVVGPVQWLAADGRSFRILGQMVHLVVAGRAPAVGVFVRVNGMRNADDSIQATHVEGVPANAMVSVTGIVGKVSGKMVQIGGLTALGAGKLAVGESVRLTGRLLESGVLEVRQTETAPEMRMFAKSDRMSLQGIVHKVDARGISLGYARVKANPGTAGNVEVGQWIRVDVSRRPDGSLDVHRLLLDSPRGGRDGATRTGAGDLGKAGHESEDGHDIKGGSEQRESHRKHEKLDKGMDFERIHNVDRVERPEQVELPEHIELPETVEIPETIDRVERRDD
jgi:hypothetical protein